MACGALAREVIALRDKHGWDAKVLALPANLHNTPEEIPQAVAKRLHATMEGFDQVILVYGDCGTAGALDRVLQELGVERIQGSHCYEQYAGERAFAEIMAEDLGTFFLTDFLARSFDHLVLEGLGLDRYPQLREDYFGNYHRMVYLQQREDPELVAKARAAAQALDLPLEIHQTGYGELETRLQERIQELQG